MSLEGTQLGNYRLLRPIGSGGMGEVYLAEDSRIQRQVAIKVIREEAAPYPDVNAVKEMARLFQREMKAISQLDHLNILPLFDFGEENVNCTKLTYLVMPLRKEEQPDLTVPAASTKQTIPGSDPNLRRSLVSPTDDDPEISTVLPATPKNGKAGGAGGRRALLPEREASSHPSSLPLPPQSAIRATRVNYKAL